MSSHLLAPIFITGSQFSPGDGFSAGSRWAGFSFTGAAMRWISRSNAPKRPKPADFWHALQQSADHRGRAEAPFRGIYEHAGTGIAITDLQGRFQSCNPAYSAMLGYTEDELRRLTFEELVHPEDREANVAEGRKLRAQEVPYLKIFNRYVRKDGTPLWVHKRVSLLRDAAGQPANHIVIATDMTEAKRQEEQIRLLMREVNHRSKNLLALVLAVARQTHAAEPDDFFERFGERIQAMAASQDLLIKNEWKGVDLKELARSQLAHFADVRGTRIELRGPSLQISAAAAQTIGMALHELTTNAGKYGALSVDNGHVEIAWGIEREKKGEALFRIDWRERGGPPVTPPSRTGFGSTVICSMIESNLDAQVALDFAVTGLTWQSTSPARAVVESKTDGL